MIRKIAFALSLAASTAAAQSDQLTPDLRPLVGRPASELADVINRYSADRESMRRKYDSPNSPAQAARFFKA
jgi:hypothetical protein